MKQLLVFLAVLFLVLGVEGWAEASPARQVQATTQYEDPDLGLHLTYPTSWERGRFESADLESPEVILSPTPDQAIYITSEANPAHVSAHSWYLKHRNSYHQRLVSILANLRAKDRSVLVLGQPATCATVAMFVGIVATDEHVVIFTFHNATESDAQAFAALLATAKVDDGSLAMAPGEVAQHLHLPSPPLGFTCAAAPPAPNFETVTTPAQVDATYGCPGAPMLLPTTGTLGVPYACVKDSASSPCPSYEPGNPHPGLDIFGTKADGHSTADQGTVPVYATQSGAIHLQGQYGGKRFAISIRFSTPIEVAGGVARSAYYTHMASGDGTTSYVLDQFNVEGATVVAGQMIGYQGTFYFNKKTGQLEPVVTHLHVTYSQDADGNESFSNALDPTPLLKARGLVYESNWTQLHGGQLTCQETLTPTIFRVKATIPGRASTSLDVWVRDTEGRRLGGSTVNVSSGAESPELSYRFIPTTGDYYVIARASHTLTAVQRVHLNAGQTNATIDFGALIGGDYVNSQGRSDDVINISDFTTFAKYYLHSPNPYFNLVGDNELRIDDFSYFSQRYLRRGAETELGFTTAQAMADTALAPQPPLPVDASAIQERAAQAEAADTALTLSPSLATYNTGEEFDMTIGLSNGTGQSMAGSDVIIQYDACSLEVVSFTNGNVFAEPRNFLVYPNRNSIELGISDTLEGQGTSASGTVGTIRFRALRGNAQPYVNVLFKPGSTVESNVVVRDSNVDVLSFAGEALYTLLGNPSRPPITGIFSPASGSYLTSWSVPMSVSVNDGCNRPLALEVKFEAYYDQAWHVLYYDETPGDGWRYEWFPELVADQSIQLRATIYGNGGLAGSAVSVGNLILDRLPPTVPIFVDVPPEVSGGSVELHWESEDALSGLASYDLEMRIGLDGFWSALATQHSSTRFTVQNLNPGQDYYFRVRARDRAGNGSAFSEPVHVRARGDGIFLYEHTYYMGRYIVLTEDDASLAAAGFDNIVSSVRFAGSYANSGWQISLFGNTDFSGPMLNLRGDDPDLNNNTPLGNDQLSSIRIWHDADDARSLTMGQSVNGTIHVPSDSDLFQFEGQAGQLVTITMDKQDGGLDPYLVLFGPAWGRLAADNDSGGSGNARILNYRLWASGTYRIFAQSYNAASAGSYLVKVSGATCVPAANGIILYEGTNYTGRCVALTSDEADLRQRSFNDSASSVRFAGSYAAAGLQISLFADANFSGALTNLSGDDPDLGNNLGNRRTSSFRLWYDDDDGRHLGFEQSLQGTVNVPSDADNYWFYGTTGQRITIAMNRDDNGLDPYLTLYGPMWGVLTTDDDGGGDGNALIYSFRLWTTGVYRVYGRSDGGLSQGDYTISLSRN